MAPSISTTTIVAVLAVALVLSYGGRSAEGQSDCVAKLVPCAAYLNSTNPSKECCDGMKEVVSTQLDCLCGILKNPAAFGGINITQALELPKYCNIPADTSACNDLAPNPSSIPPPAVRGDNGSNGVGRRISWMGMPALLIASALTFFY